jgi:hypothetical protein
MGSYIFLKMSHLMIAHFVWQTVMQNVNGVLFWICHKKGFVITKIKNFSYLSCSFILYNYGKIYYTTILQN